MNLLALQGLLEIMDPPSNITCFVRSIKHVILVIFVLEITDQR